MAATLFEKVVAIAGLSDDALAILAPVTTSAMWSPSTRQEFDLLPRGAIAHGPRFRSVLHESELLFPSEKAQILSRSVLDLGVPIGFPLTARTILPQPRDEADVQLGWVHG